ncbi:L-2-hydroxyglutarate oxidase [Jatrophihabitans cynanchi]|uniref:L-2-hydroxyglutarate oxidase n=1 Tax=Jatrophihabitans cynanchi TaxID=2944128 RepID=A0ABY7K5Q1_9ACTN|nr:L-2-hydroxyglutarate oxidase [Jatrophihabitans sp. SB3-54]WAX58446.1 L-2-hydroxyglutarate oxidase [Jatrophihabitans sp. SB3-54]
MRVFSPVADYCIIGAGIVGLAVARELLLTRPGYSVVVLDKESTVGAHQTGHNSGVVHAGLYYKPGSAKSQLCRRGVGLLREFCAEHGLAYDECGKLVVARDLHEMPALERLFERATDAGVPGVRIIGPAAVRAREPHCRAYAALLSPSTAIVDFGAITRAIAQDVLRLGGEIRLGCQVQAIGDRGDRVEVGTTGGPVMARRLVICAGLQTDRVSRMAGGSRGPQIVPFRGEYYHLRRDRAVLVNGLIYPVPDPRYPFLGTHFTKLIGGAGVSVGPNAVLALAREGYRRRDVRLADVAELAGWSGTWRMARSHWRTGIYELAGSLLKSLFARRARSYIPELRTRDLVRPGAGVRAQAVSDSGALVDDFVIERHGRVLSVRNAPSPAATASFAIAQFIVQRLGAG